MDNLYLNRRKIQLKKNNNICKERRVFIYILDNMSVWHSVSHNKKILRKGK